MKDLFNGSNDFEKFSKIKKILWVLFIYLGLIITILVYFTAIHPLIYLFTN
jgi:hypothetical protein